MERDDVETFLRDAGEEGVTWEAKADDDEERHRPGGEEPGRLRNTTIHKAVCGLANQIGGYLIIGARRDDGAERWHVAGIHSNNPEPETWLRDVIEGGLSPVPRCDVRAWRLDTDRMLGVVEVQPVPEPPCMTRQGHIYERVSGRTVRVQDPTLLDALRRRGEHARDAAVTFADDGALLALSEGEWTHERSVAIALGLAPVGQLDDDISSRLFTDTFRQRLVDEAADLSEAGFIPGDPTTGGTIVRQSYMTRVAEWHGNTPPRRTLGIGDPPAPVVAAVTMHATWNGAASASLSLHGDLLRGFSTFDHFVIPAWRSLANLVEELGGYGPSQLWLRVRVGSGNDLGIDFVRRGEIPADSLYASLPDTKDVAVGRFLEAPGADGREVGRMQRELQRAAGIESYEPEP